MQLFSSTELSDDQLKQTHPYGFSKLQFDEDEKNIYAAGGNVVSELFTTVKFFLPIIRHKAPLPVQNIMVQYSTL